MSEPRGSRSSGRWAGRPARSLPALWLLLLLSAALAAGAQPPAAPETTQRRPDRPASLMEADRFIDRILDGRRVSVMLGNVFIDRDSLTARSDSAYYYRDLESYEFLGRVHMTRGAAVLTCRRALYDRLTAAGDFFGDVRIVEDEIVGTGRRGETRDQGRTVRLMEDALLVTPDYSVLADTIFRDRVSGEGEAFGHVRIMEPGSRNLVTGDHAVFHAEGEVAEVDRRPVLTSREQKGGPLTSSAGRMFFYRQEDRVVMTDSVRIRQGQTRASADTAVAYGRERLVLTGEPVVSMGAGSTMLGERIEFLYDEGELRRVILLGQARMEDTAPDSQAAFYSGLPDLDVLEGDSISVEFDRREIQRSVVVGNARSRYTPLDLEDEVATNDVKGDTIVIDFQRQRVRRVTVSGRMSGVYRFARVPDMRERLGRSRRLADALARSDADSSALTDSLGAAVGFEMNAEVDSLAALLGLPQGTAAPPDSLVRAALDSLAAAGADTAATVLDFTGSAQDVTYSGGTVLFRLDDRSIDIRRDGKLVFGTMVLTAGHIKLDTDDRELYAEGDPLVEDNETIAGDRMGYNFGHKTGAVADGVTAFEEYYYVGDEIRRFSDTTLKICGGRMTSCDLAEPHYHFWADKMKMRAGDKVVAAPIVLRIGRVPVFALPFYFRNLKEGRRSGILFPSFDFGWSSREGRYIRDFGYYWAANDYTDFLFEADYNERRQLSYRVTNQYVKRYAFDGRIDYTRTLGLGNDQRREWEFFWTHTQPALLDDYNFRAKVKMASTTLTRSNLNTGPTQDLVDGSRTSSVTVSRNFGWVNSTFSATRDERTNAEDDRPSTNALLYNMTLPSLSLNFPRLTFAAPLRGGAQGSLLGNLARAASFSQGYRFLGTAQGNETTDIRSYQGSGNWSLAVGPLRTGLLNLTFGSNGAHSWSRTTTAGQLWSTNTDTAGVYENADDRVETRNTSLSFRATAGTALYGLFPLRVGPLQALRHTIRFSTTYSVSPGLGRTQMQGSNLTFSLNNRFDAKYLGTGPDSTQVEKKLDGLLDWNLSAGYDPDRAAGQRWSDITSGLSVSPSQNRYLQLKVSNTIDPKKLALKSTRFSYGLNFSGRLDMGTVAERRLAVRNEAIDRLGLPEAPADTAAVTPLDDLFEDDPETTDPFRAPDRRPQEGKDLTEGGRYLPFDISSNISYSYTNATAASGAQRRTTGSFTVRGNLTQNWDIRYTNSFDLVTSSVTRQQFSLNRDLHCWRLEFNRTVSSYDSTFGFRIYLKSIPALKFTRGEEQYMSPLTGMGGL